MSLFEVGCFIHNKPKEQGSWATHEINGVYLSLALQHFQCWRMHAINTAATRISDTVVWLPEPFTLPGHSPLEVLSAVVTNLATAIVTITATELQILN
jgi:hypothetical protein